MLDPLLDPELDPELELPEPELELNPELDPEPELVLDPELDPELELPELPELELELLLDPESTPESGLMRRCLERRSGKEADGPSVGSFLDAHAPTIDPKAPHTANATARERAWEIPIDASPCISPVGELLRDLQDGGPRSSADGRSRKSHGN